MPLYTRLGRERGRRASQPFSQKKKVSRLKRKKELNPTCFLPTLSPASQDQTSHMHQTERTGNYTSQHTCTSRRVWQGRTMWTWRLGKLPHPAGASGSHRQSTAAAVRRGVRRVCRRTCSGRRGCRFSRGGSAGSQPLVPAAPVRWRHGSSEPGVQTVTAVQDPQTSVGLSQASRWAGTPGFYSEGLSLKDSGGGWSGTSRPGG